MNEVIADSPWGTVWTSQSRGTLKKEKVLRPHIAIITSAIAALTASPAIDQDDLLAGHPLVNPASGSTLDFGYFPPTLPGMACANIGNDGLPGSVVNLTGYAITGALPAYFDIANWDAIYKSLSVGQTASPCPIFLGSPTPGIYQADVIVWSDSGDVLWHVRAGAAYPGDANLDGTVNFADYQALESGFGSGTTWAQGDFNADHQVAFIDYQLLEANFGKQAVPEPITLSLLLAGGLALAARRGR